MTVWNVHLGEAAFIAAVLAIALTATFFVVCRRYEEGLFGNLFLGLLIITCLVVLYDFIAGKLTLPAPMWRVMLISLAVFMVRHAWRFAMFHWHGAFGWRRPHDMDARASEHS